MPAINYRETNTLLYLYISLVSLFLSLPFWSIVKTMRENIYVSVDVCGRPIVVLEFASTVRDLNDEWMLRACV